MWERPSFEVWMIDLVLKSIVGFFSLSSLKKKKKNMEIIALDRVQAALCPFRHQMGISVDNCHSHSAEIFILVSIVHTPDKILW